MKHKATSVLILAVSGSQAAMAHPGHQHIVQGSSHLVMNNLLIAVAAAGVLLAVGTLIRRRNSQ